jgi:hypothetical protein
MRLLGLAILLLFGFLSCSPRDQVDIKPSAFYPTYAVRSLVVHPILTDPKITTGLAPGFAYVPSNPQERKRKLFIFLPSTSLHPQAYQKILKSAAENGYHAIGIHYENSVDFSAYCGRQSGENCHENVLKEFLTGEDHSPYVYVGESNGLENRIIKMIKYLNTVDSSGEWSRFGRCSPWGSVSIAGHNQGAEFALYFSKVNRVDRVTLFGGPSFLNAPLGISPSWMYNLGSTSYHNIYGFTNRNDYATPWNRITNFWWHLGVDGYPVNVDKATNFDGSQQLYTDYLPPQTNGPFSPTNGSTVLDVFTPIDSVGRPKYEAAWRYMCFPR